MCCNLFCDLNKNMAYIIDHNIRMYRPNGCEVQIENAVTKVTNRLTSQYVLVY